MGLVKWRSDRVSSLVWWRGRKVAGLVAIVKGVKAGFETAVTVADKVVLSAAVKKGDNNVMQRRGVG